MSYRERAALVVAVANQKGGVGKTTTVVNVAHALVGTGLRVLTVDGDPQSSLTIYGGHDPRVLDRDGRTLWTLLIEGGDAKALVLEGPPDLLSASIRLASAEGDLLREWNGATLLRDRLQSVLPAYDVVLIDCSPSLGLLTVNALAVADLVLVPVKTDYLSLMGVSLLFETVERIQARLNPQLAVLGVVPTMHDSRNRHDREVLAELERELDGRMPMFTPIRRSTVFDQAAVASIPTITADPEHRALVGYLEIAEEIRRRVGAR